jgi:hypothetical protein
MRIMIVWRTVPGKYNGYRNISSRGSPDPSGSQDLGSLHVPGSIVGWHLVERGLAAVGQHVAEWAHLLECEVYPVVEDAEAADAAKRVFGGK